MYHLTTVGELLETAQVSSPFLIWSHWLTHHKFRFSTLILVRACPLWHAHAPVAFSHELSPSSTKRTDGGSNVFEASAVVHIAVVG